MNEDNNKGSSNLFWAGFAIGLFCGVIVGFQSAYIFSQAIIYFNENTHHPSRNWFVFFVMFGVVCFFLGEFTRLFWCRKDFIGWYVYSKTLVVSYIISSGVVIGIIGAIISLILLFLKV